MCVLNNNDAPRQQFAINYPKRLYGAKVLNLFQKMNLCPAN